MPLQVLSKADLADRLPEGTPRPVVGAIAEFLAGLSERAGERVERVILYGSAARGQMGHDSDVDLLVLWRGDHWNGHSTATGIAGRIFVRTGVLLSPAVVTPDRWSEMAEGRAKLYLDIQREGVLLV